MNKKNRTSLVAKLQEDLKKLGKDWENLLSRKKSASDQKFLGEIAQDIKTLNEDAVMAETDHSLRSTVDMIHNMLTTPWGAPFVSDTTLLEAAIGFRSQRPEESDLHELMSRFTVYSSLLTNQFLTILESLSEDLEE